MSLLGITKAEAHLVLDVLYHCYEQLEASGADDIDHINITDAQEILNGILNTNVAVYPASQEK